MLVVPTDKPRQINVLVPFLTFVNTEIKSSNFWFTRTLKCTNENEKLVFMAKMLPTNVDSTQCFLNGSGVGDNGALLPYRVYLC